MQKTEEAAHPTRRRTLDLSVTQVAASALAAVVGAVLASELGVYGTIIGAAVVSTGATVGSALFQHLFRRTGEQLRDLATSAPTRPVSAVPTLPTAPTASFEQPAADFDPFDPGGERTRMMAALAPPVPVDSIAVYRGRTTWRPKGWKTYALMGVLVFGLAMGTVTAVELVAGKPVAAIVRNEPGSGTSFGGGSVEHGSGSGGSGGSDPATVPSTTPSGPAGGGEPSSDPSSGASSGPSEGASDGPDPTPSSTPSGTPQPEDSASAAPSGGATAGAGAAVGANPSTAPTTG